MSQPQNWPCHGLQTDDVSPAKMAEARRRKPYARDHRRDCIQRRDQTTSKRRLITPSPTFGHSSHQRPFFLSVLAFEKPPNPGKYKRRSRVFTFQPKPVIRRRFSPLASQKLVAGTRQRRVFHPYNEIFGASHASARPALGFSQHRTAYTQNSPTLRPVLR